MKEGGGGALGNGGRRGEGGGGKESFFARERKHQQSEEINATYNQPVLSRTEVEKEGVNQKEGGGNAGADPLLLGQGPGPQVPRPGGGGPQSGKNTTQRTLAREGEHGEGLKSRSKFIKSRFRRASREPKGQENLRGNSSQCEGGRLPRCVPQGP